MLAWLQAARLPSQTYIFLALAWGQTLVGAPLNRSIALLVFAFGLFDQLYIVFANDFADRDSDGDNDTATPFSGGSRVLVEGLLEPKSLARAAVAMAVLLVACSAILSLVFHRPHAPWFALAALVFLWMYSFPPVRASYRGWGEFLQMAGVGAVLPAFGFYAQSGSLSGFPWLLLFSLLPAQLACAMATALPDEPSDRRTGKTTLAVHLGQTWAQRAIVALEILCLLSLAFVLPPELPRAKVALLLAAPAFAIVGQVGTPTGIPGELSMLVRVFLALLMPISLLLGLVVLGFPGFAT